MYQQLLDWLNKGKNKKVRGWKHRPNVLKIIRGENCVHVQYHETIILTVNSNNDMTVNSGGYQTVTTKRWLGEFGVSVFSDRGIWQVRHFGKTYIFADYMILSVTGEVSGAGRESESAKIKKLQKQVKFYSKQFARKFFAGEIPPPDLGDCFYCQMRTDAGETLGEFSSDIDHLLSHIEESYFVPSLLWRAIETSDKASNFLKHTIGEIWHSSHEANSLDSTMQRQLESCLTSYLKTQFRLPR